MNDYITTPICEKNMSGDFITELSMPDYEPEIRRLLRVDLTLTPAMGFFDTNKVGMNGEIIYNILYMGNDGALYSTRTRESYELAEAFKPSEKSTEPVCVICEAIPESLVSRATAPRKLSLRCKLRGSASVFGETELSEHSTYIENPESIERLNNECEYITFFPSAISEVRLSDDFTAQLPSGVSGDIRIICHNVAAVCESIEMSNEEATVKGTLNLSMLATVDDGEAKPFKLSHKLSFEEAVDVPELTPLCRCTATVCCTECDFSVEDNQVFCEPTVMIRINAEDDRRAEYTKDIYSTEAMSDCTLKQHEIRKLGKTFSGNITVSMNESLEEIAIPTGSEIFDATSNAVVKNIEQNGNKTIISGILSLNVLTSSENEYSAKELRTPFKYEFETGVSSPIFTDLAIIPLSPRTKIDGERVICDCELHIMGKFCQSSEFDAVNEVVFRETIARDDSVTVCFPSPTDTAWDIAKRYHIPTESITSQEQSIKKGEAVIF